ncbi:hypothetical protein [Paraburkholderia solisilvae]|uniref:Uncharacterized protein n=1 Tax=Paraburkholderia solisilvae TaxID=624376 RepID=A0A6J5E1Y2_9BURK|nr:hypothetical protein [Paraburkholderia solisilvae]CAB3759401.1 hypothetical protein LMG29739_03144 [Paraburkholderia solisilvae]
MQPVTRADGVTPGLTSRPSKSGEIVDKKQLCERLGWSRPKLDRRLRTDENFPVLWRSNRSGPWQFDLDAVVAHLEAAGESAERRWMPAAGSRAGMPDDVSGELRRELSEMRALRQAVEALLMQLGAGAKVGSAVAEEPHGDR